MSAPPSWSVWHELDTDVLVVRRDADDVQIRFPATVLILSHARYGQHLYAEAERKLAQFESRTRRAAAPHSRFVDQGEGHWLGE